ncbi:MAG: ribosomal protein S18-alanine N-acetyltransferase [Roseburia sp.]|nr:ribosomal protein S18-alanine N-acetyltransferase [Anaeroplasma bactoclasticum]MCM1195751.1 ribosomal protein S18-alanine N-acetyltransferase [Roseburia sp.]MCM1556976.1 ribosomal protein S18-alanine N-acetyltransferase [Anaeroplasma bactoclasticum]
MIRKYVKEDISRIVELEKNHLESSLEESFYLSDLNNPLARHYVFEVDLKILGFISSVFDGFSLEILNFVIDKPYQSKGYGTRALATFLDELVPLGLNNVSLEVRQSNKKAIHVYEKLGFKTIRVKKEYYKNKEDAYFMQKLYDEKKDIANLEGILFSKKEGLKYTSDFKERYCLNYYDLYDYKIDSIKDFTYDTYILFLSNWIDEKLFAGFDISSCALMHVNAYHYHSLAKKTYPVSFNYLKDFMDYTYKINREYGFDYAKKYAKFNYDKILQGIIKTYSVVINEKTIGTVLIIEYHHSIFIYGLYVDEKYRHQGFASNLIDACIEYAKKMNKCEVYLEAEFDDTPIEMYRKMNFIEIETLYESFLEK